MVTDEVSYQSRKKARHETKKLFNLHMLVDSGCTSHMAAIEPTNLQNFSIHCVQISTAGSSYLYSRGEGTFGPLRSLKAVPGIKQNLLSVSMACQEDNTVIFTKDSVDIYKNRDVVIAGISTLHGYQQDGLYHLHVSSELPVMSAVDVALLADCVPENKYQLWHNRLCHASDTKLWNMLKYNVVSGFKFTSSERKRFKHRCICEGCAKGKLTLKPVRRRPLKPDKMEETLQPGSLIVADIFFSPVPSIKGSICCLVLMDAYSRRLWRYFMKDKSETFARIKQWHEEVQADGINIGALTTLRTDNGGEFSSNELIEYLRQSKIRRERCPPYMHVHLIERHIRTIQESARSMMAQAKLRPSFWAEAVSTAIYVLNRMPSGSNHKITRLQLYNGHKPNLNHIRTFGCTAWAKKYDDLRKKWDDKAFKGIFCGYDESSPKTWRIFNPITQSFINTSNVVFNESLSDKEGSRSVINYNSTQKDELAISVSQPLLPDSLSNYEVLKDYEATDLDVWLDQALQSVNTTSQTNEVEYGKERYSHNNSGGDEDKNYTSNGEEQNSDLQPRRWSSRLTSKPLVTYSNQCYLTESEVFSKSPFESAFSSQERSVPKTMKQAMSCKDKDHWQSAIQSEVSSLVKNQTFEVVELPAGKRKIGLNWVFKIKEDQNGNIERYKARCTVLGNLQREGIDYGETFSPVVRYSTLRTLLALAALRGYYIHQMDVDTAFLYGILPDDEEVYVDIPPGYPVPSNLKGTQCLAARVRKGIYGLKQSPRLWNKTLSDFMLSIGFTVSSSDPCLYSRVTDGQTVYVTVFVDDLVISGSTLKAIDKFKRELKEKFSMKDLGELKYVLGIRVTRNWKNGEIYLDQEKYCNDLLTRFRMCDCNPASIPLQPNIHLKRDTNQDKVKTYPYREVVGSLMYLMVTTRPDISFAVSYLARYLNCFGSEHISAAKQILRYIKGSSKRKITYGNQSNELVVGYSDSDWASDKETSRSVSGYVFFLAGGPISWATKTQPTIALSSTEAEYMALTMAATEAMAITMLCNDLMMDISQPILIYEDNKGAIAMSMNPVRNNRNKHIAIKHHFIREKIQNKDIMLEYVSTSKMIADTLTKALPKSQFEVLRGLLLGESKMPVLQNNDVTEEL
jgi:hypothetical protein